MRRRRRRRRRRWPPSSSSSSLGVGVAGFEEELSRELAGLDITILIVKKNKSLEDPNPVSIYRYPLCFCSFPYPTTLFPRGGNSWDEMVVVGYEGNGMFLSCLDGTCKCTIRQVTFHSEISTSQLYSHQQSQFGIF
jgi:hypothetical protein